MRVAIASRIFAPEPAAAAFRLTVLARVFSEQGHDTTVLTVRTSVPEGSGVRTERFAVRRFPVLRDRSGYVRGYLQYLSFDIPLFFRVLFGPRRDAIVIEPPPTTWFFAGLAARLRGIPYFIYAADIWSDAAESTGAPAFVVRAVRRMERSASLGSRGVFAVNEGIADRVQQIAPGSTTSVVGNGIDTEVFRRGVAADAVATGLGPYAIYTGTASEWQGAEVFVRAIARLSDEGVALRLVFLGQGTALTELKRLAEEINAPVEFHDAVPPEEAATWLRGAALGLASIRPGAGYDFAYPTKIFAAWGCGTPVVYAGPGPAREVLDAHPGLGRGVEHDPDSVADAIRQVLLDERVSRSEIADWALQNVSLASTAERAVRFVEQRITGLRSEGDPV